LKHKFFPIPFFFIRKKVKFIEKNNPSFKFTGEVMIQGDKGIPFILLEKVMYTCGQAGYSGISLTVISRG